MKHYGDITKLNGAELPNVNCIIGGSPCQDLSTAGKRKGLEGERSGLFMEQVRIFKEMRDEAVRRSVKPVRWFCWENVPGALSSGSPRGADFQAVLEEICKIADPDCPAVPIPPKGWPKAGCLVDADRHFSLAWRIHDAQYYGVPQRRRRIALVADFDGLDAAKVVFECDSTDFREPDLQPIGESLPGHFEPCGETR